MMQKFFLKRLKLFYTIILIPAMILFLFMVILISISEIRTMKETSRVSVHNITDSFHSTTETCFSQQDMMTLNFRVSLSMRKILQSSSVSYTDYVFLNSIQTFMGSITDSHPLIDSIYLYLDGYDAFFSSEKAIRFLKNDGDSTWYDIYSAVPHDRHNFTVTRNLPASNSSGSTDVLTIFKRMTYMDGVIVANLPKSALQTYMKSTLPSWDNTLMLLNSDRQVLLQQDDTAIDLSDFEEADFTSCLDKFQWKRINHRLSLVYAVFDPDYQLYFVQITPFHSVLVKILENLAWPALMLILIFLLVLFLAYHTTSSNFKQIQYVINLFSDAEKGIYPTTDTAPSPPDTEYDLIMNNVIRMFLNTTFLRSQLAEQNYKKQAAELTALQLQINPHFMINTLQTLNFEVYKITKGPSPVNTIINSLSDILTYSLAKTETPVTLRDEIEHIHKYVEIQKYRFIDSFFYYEEIDDDVLTHPFKRLLLQPLLENSISHGIRPSGRRGCVKIRIFKRQDYLSVSVIDNGIGISRENLAKLKDSLSSGTAARIGLDNVNKRLILTYGQQSALRITSKEHFGTCVSFHIPFHRD